MKRIKIVMVDRDEYMDDRGKDDSSFWHILVSNSHKYPDWIEKSIDNCMREGKDLMIGRF